MYQIDTQLLPTQCPPGDALRIYFYRFLNFGSVVLIALVPLWLLILYFLREALREPGVTLVIWLLFAFYSAASAWIGYIAWSLRGMESLIREIAVFDQMFDETKRRYAAIQEQRTNFLRWSSQAQEHFLELAGRLSEDDLAVHPEVIELLREIKIYDQLLEDMKIINHLLDVMEHRAAHFDIATGHVRGRIAALKLQFNALEENMLKLNDVARFLYEQFSAREHGKSELSTFS